MLGLSNVEIIMNPFTSSYWLGSAIAYDDVLYIIEARIIVTDDFRYVKDSGVRPVITIPTSELSN